MTPDKIYIFILLHRSVEVDVERIFVTWSVEWGAKIDVFIKEFDIYESFQKDVYLGRFYIYWALGD